MWETVNGLISTPKLTDLMKKLWERNKDNDKVKMFCILFARPESKFALNEVFPLLPYLNERSEDNIDFYFPGYTTIEGTSNDCVVIEINGEKWTFSHSDFNLFRKDIEKECMWRYSGAVDLLIMNARTKHGFAAIDYKSVVCCQIDEMIRLGALSSLEKFFEKIVRHVEEYDGTDPTWGFSDRMGISTGMSALKRFVLSLLPGDLSQDIQHAAHFAVRDLAKST